MIWAKCSFIGPAGIIFSVRLDINGQLYLLGKNSQYDSLGSLGMSRVSIEVYLSPSADRGSLAACHHLMVRELRMQFEDQIEIILGRWI